MGNPYSKSRLEELLVRTSEKSDHLRRELAKARDETARMRLLVWNQRFDVVKAKDEVARLKAEVEVLFGMLEDAERQRT